MSVATLNLADLPTDVIFQLVSKISLQASLQDVWTLTKLSRAFRDLSADRGFWLAALTSSPSPNIRFCPFQLFDLDVRALKTLASSTIKLDRNWARSHPLIAGQVRKWRLGGDYSVLETNCLFQFPGSELFIFYSSKLLKCFDCRKEACTSIFDLDAYYVRYASYEVLPDKSVILGLALRGGPRFNESMLLYLKLTLDSCTSSIVTTVLMRSTLPQASDCQKPFVSSQIVGAVHSLDKTTELLAYNLATGVSTSIKTDIPIHYTISRRLDFSFRDGDLYMLADDGPKALVYCCPRSSLPYEQDSEPKSTLTFGDLVPVLFPTKIWKRRGPVCSQMLSNASFVKLHDTLGPPGSNFTTSVRFWPRADFGGAFVTEVTVPGVCPGENTMQMGMTGRCVVAALLGLGPGSGCSLFLLRSIPDGKGSDICSSHELEVPPEVCSGPAPNVLAVDDHRGVIWLAVEGELLAVPYA